MTELENGINLIKKKQSLIISIKNTSISYENKEFKTAADALDEFINLIDRRDGLIENCKNIDIKLNTFKNIEDIKTNKEYVEIETNIKSSIKEILKNEEQIKIKVSKHRKTLGKNMAENKNSQRLFKKYMSAPDMVEGYFFDSKK